VPCADVDDLYSSFVAAGGWPRREIHERRHDVHVLRPTRPSQLDPNEMVPLQVDVAIAARRTCVGLWAAPRCEFGWCPLRDACRVDRVDATSCATLVFTGLTAGSRGVRPLA
jgi:hypothetical protein